MANEKRLIDANALKDRFKLRINWLDKDVHGKYSLGLFHGAEYDAKLIDEIPTVDAVEVVHGHMVERIVDHECPWYTIYDCSECGCTVERWHNYCPNCGAKMAGDWNG